MSNFTMLAKRKCLLSMRRRAFTLVEMLVSLALVLFIMYILAQGISTGLETFRQLKATGELDEKLRMAATLLRQDLKLDHFEGKRRLSDPSFWVQGPPREGFFHIEQKQPSIAEGVDGDGIPLFYAVTHSLHFAIKLRGSQRDDFLSANVPTLSPLLSPTTNTTFLDAQVVGPDSRFQDPPAPGSAWAPYNSQWAEVVYFLAPNGASASGTPLFSLYRRQRLALPNNRDMNWGLQTIAVKNPTELALGLWQYASLSCKKRKPDVNGGPVFPDSLYFNNPTDLTVPERRFGMNAQPGSYGLPASYAPLQDPAISSISPADYQRGSDLLLTDVVSFSVRVLSPEVDPNNFSDLRIFDTWSTVQDDIYNYGGVQPPNQVRIVALEIVLRVYDQKTQQTRQITIEQEM